MNIVEIAGHLGADPETRVTPNGLKITTIRLAANSRRAGKDETIWWRVTIFGDRFDKLLPHLKKGSPLIVLGDLNKPEIWMDKEGRPQITLEVVAEMLKFSPFGRPDRPQEGPGSYSYGAPASASHSQSNAYSAPNYSQSAYGSSYNAHQEQQPFSEPHYQIPAEPRAPHHSPSGGIAHPDDEIPF